MLQRFAQNRMLAKADWKEDVALQLVGLLLGKRLQSVHNWAARGHTQQ
jgi:hypothetical protein